MCRHHVILVRGSSKSLTKFRICTKFVKDLSKNLPSITYVTGRRYTPIEINAFEAKLLEICSATLQLDGAKLDTI